jgi:predicted transcriptional regulator
LENKRKQRSRYYIIAEILNQAKDGILKTQLMYKVNLSYTQLNKYLSFIIRKELLSIHKKNGNRIYQITAKGKQYLDNYKEILNFLRSKENYY